MNGKQCYNCGAFNAMTNQICCNCGANLVQPQAPQQNFGQPMYNQQPMANGFYPQPQKKSNTGLIIALSIPAESPLVKYAATALPVASTAC